LKKRGDHSPRQRNSGGEGLYLHIIIISIHHCLLNKIDKQYS